jgi:serine/threonine protein kinase
MLFEMVTGRRPFSGRNDLEYWHLHKSGTVPEMPVPGPATLGEDFRALATIVNRCLEKDPSKRFGSFLELRKALEPIYFDLSTSYAPTLAMEPAISSSFTEKELLEEGFRLITLGKPREAWAIFDRIILGKKDYRSEVGLGRINPEVIAKRLKLRLLVDVIIRDSQTLEAFCQAQHLGKDEAIRQIRDCLLNRL